MPYLLYYSCSQIYTDNEISIIIAFAIRKNIELVKYPR